VGVRLFRVYVYQDQTSKGDTGSVIQWAVGNFTSPNIQDSLGADLEGFDGLHPLPLEVGRSSRASEAVGGLPVSSCVGRLHVGVFTCTPALGGCQNSAWMWCSSYEASDWGIPSSGFALAVG
jgi:hypothetical protein